MKKEILLILILYLFTGCYNQSLPENFNPDVMNICVIIDIPKKFEVGFVNPDYYYSLERKQNAQMLINTVKPLDYTLEQIESSLKNRFSNTKAKIQKVIRNDIIYLEDNYNGPSTREPAVRPEIDIIKMKDKINTDYVLLYRIRSYRLELEVRPAVKDRLNLDAVIAIYDVNENKKIYQRVLGTPMGMSFYEKKFNLREHQNDDINQELIKKNISDIVNEITASLTKELFKKISK